MTYLNIGPQWTVELLDKLDKYGLTDEAFARLHHFILKEKNETINNMREYCRGKSVFQRGGTNERVCMRLEFVLEMVQNLSVNARPTRNDFLIFAQQSVRKYPMD